MSTKVHARRGAQALEFALTLPILLMLLSATIDYGFFFSQAMQLTTATQQAARAGAAASDTTTFVTQATEVGSHVWTASGYANQPTFTVTEVVTDGAADRVDVDGIAGPDGAMGDIGVQVVGTVAVQCLFCLPLVELPASAEHVAVEHWFSRSSF